MDVAFPGFILCVYSKYSLINNDISGRVPLTHEDEYIFITVVISSSTLQIPFLISFPPKTVLAT